MIMEITYIVVMLLDIFLILLSIHKLSAASASDSKIIAATLMIGFAMLITHLSVTPHHFEDLTHARQTVWTFIQGAIATVFMLILVRRF